MKIGIVIDPHKLKAFKKRLTKEGYEFEVVEGKQITSIAVEIEKDGLFALTSVIKSLQRETARGLQ